LGAGGGGFFLFHCPEEKHEQLRKAMQPLRELKFKFENEGSKLVYVGDEYYERWS
ncbi:MAG: GHMP kinase, partial [Candidatus Aenigmarchaeota archaeon]|nr:GHMP kinase [Candidatus Aenigmarchaeota archaeon]